MVTKSQIEREAKNAVKNILKSPFAVLKAINKNKDNEAIVNWLKSNNIEALTLEMLLQYETGGLPIFCKLQKIADLDYLDGTELRIIKIKKAYYELVPVTLSVEGFFQAFKARKKIQEEEKRVEIEAIKLTEKKAKESKEKKVANRAAKVAAKAKELQAEFPDLPETAILQIAEKFFKAA